MTKEPLKDKIILAAWVIALTALFWVTSHAQADDYSFKYGMGLNEQKPTGSIKLFALREERPFFGPFRDARELGMWVDNLGNGRSGAAYGKYQLGLTPGVDTVGVFGGIFWGVQLQSSTDTQLGGLAQFAQDASIGIRDRGCAISFGYSHVSSAGIFHPNKGRDFVTLSAGVSW